MKKLIILFSLLFVLAGCGGQQAKSPETLTQESKIDKTESQNASESKKTLKDESKKEESKQESKKEESKQESKAEESKTEAKGEEHPAIPNINDLKPGTYKVGNMTFKKLPADWKYVMGTNGEHWIYTPAAIGRSFIQFTYTPLNTTDKTEIEQVNSDPKGVAQIILEDMVKSGKLKITGDLKEEKMLDRPLFCWPIQFENKGKWLNGFFACRSDEKGVLIALTINYEKNDEGLNRLLNVLHTFSLQ